MCWTNCDNWTDLICFLEQGMLVPELPAGEGLTPAESEAPEEVMERLAHLEQLVVQLKELIRDKDTQLIQKDTELTNKDVQLKVNNLHVFVSVHYIFFCNCFYDLAPFFFAFYLQNEKDEAEARFTKLKLQAKAKMASLNKQITDLKGQGGAPVSLNNAN